MFAEDRRLRILEVLDKSPGYTANQVVLNEMLAQLGHLISSDKTRVELAWLAEMTLIELLATDSLFVARLTQRGQDVATGRATVPGVSVTRPT
ncbi:ArsR family transcriptional regulator [Pseudomethylobacillus aquaticus]|uniref:ArsR family transcriptional regulator n=1 Tax=Pseudomethylobacillus aquaticus TaxID=2676064 RepID=A0A3N0V1F7_9PROT|nr:ArsR family transcriptional regulator [Pseudomethylobacillus aquaticus]